MAHIEKRGPGRWRARYRGPDGKERSRTFDRKVDAERWLDVRCGELAKGEWVDPAGARTTIAAWCAEWRRRQVVRALTGENIDSRLKVHILPKWGDRKLGSITPGEVQLWVHELVAGGLAPLTVDRLVRRFASIMNAAVEERLIGVSPCRGVKLPEIHREQVRPLEHDVVARLVDAMPDELRAAAIVAAGAGLRRGEVLGLTVGRVDFLRRAIRVDRQIISAVGAPVVLAPPKTKASVRTVPVGKVVVDALAAHLARYPAVNGVIFTHPSGAMWRADQFNQRFAAARKRAELDGVKFHDLRHYYASVLIDAGEPSHVIKERLGHASITETHNTYGHLFESADDRTRDATDEALRGLGSQA